MTPIASRSPWIKLLVPILMTILFLEGVEGLGLQDMGSFGITKNHKERDRTYISSFSTAKSRIWNCPGKCQSTNQAREIHRCTLRKNYFSTLIFRQRLGVLANYHTVSFCDKKIIIKCFHPCPRGPTKLVNAMAQKKSKNEKVKKKRVQST